MGQIHHLEIRSALCRSDLSFPNEPSLKRSSVVEVNVSNVRRDFKRAISSMTTYSRAPWVATTGWETAGYFVDLATGYTQAHSALSSLKQIGREPTISELNEE